MKVLFLREFIRDYAESEPDTMYIFTDTLLRSGGHGGIVDPGSWYSKEYLPGSGMIALHYPLITTSALRGLPNAYPLCLSKGLGSRKDGWSSGQWQDYEVQDFIRIVSEELKRIEEDLRNYTTLVLPGPDIFGRHGSMITPDRCPLIWSWLSIKIEKLIEKAKNL